MKRIAIIALAIFLGMACSEIYAQKSQKVEMTQEEVQAKLDSLRNERANKIQALNEELNKNSSGPEYEIQMPCNEESLSNDEHYGALGIGEGLNMSEAMVRAMQKAQMELSRRVGESFDEIYVQKVCQQMQRDSRGSYTAYVALQYPKNSK